MSAKLINVVLDLETLGLAEDAAIIQIGCVVPVFDIEYLPPNISSTFEATIRYEDCLSSEFSKDSVALKWWADQKPSVKSIVFSGQETYVDAFDQLTFWLQSFCVPVAIWGNGSDFDNRLLAYSLAAYGHHRVWDFRNNRDLRTLRALFPVVVPADPTEVKHTAIGDALYEARILDRARNVFDLNL